jgi:hypothetical protein
MPPIFDKGLFAIFILIGGSFSDNICALTATLFHGKNSKFELD